MLNFYDFYDSLTQEQRRVFKDVLDIHFNWAPSTFYQKKLNGSISKPEERILSFIIEHFLEDYENYCKQVVKHIADGNTLRRMQSPRRDIKQPNKIISMIYEKLSKNECPTKACQ